MQVDDVDIDDSGVKVEDEMGNEVDNDDAEIDVKTRPGESAPATGPPDNRDIYRKLYNQMCDAAEVVCAAALLSRPQSPSNDLLSRPSRPSNRKSSMQTAR